MKDNNTKTTTTEANRAGIISGDVVDATLKTRVTLGTKLYSKFTFLSGNRGVNESHINKLVAMIVADEDWLIFNPIIVDSDFRVLDGQHRLLAAQKANARIWYNVRQSKTSLEVVARINDCQKSWLPDDFVFIDFNYGTPNANIQQGDTVTVSGSEIYTVITGSYNQTTRTRGILFCARTT